MHLGTQEENVHVTWRNDVITTNTQIEILEGGVNVAHNKCSIRNITEDNNMNETTKVDTCSRTEKGSSQNNPSVATNKTSRKQATKNKTNKANHNINEPKEMRHAPLATFDKNKVDTNISSSFSLSNTQKPKIFTGPHDDDQYSVDPWRVKSPFDDFNFRMVALPKPERQEYVKFLEKVHRMSTLPETSYKEGDSYAGQQRASFREATRVAFMNSRLAALRKTPARIVLPKCLESSEEDLLETSESVSDFFSGTVRMDEIQVKTPRFDPYHSEYDPDDLKTYFLTLMPPHLSAKFVKVTKSVDTVPRASKRKSGLFMAMRKSKDGKNSVSQ